MSTSIELVREDATETKPPIDQEQGFTNQNPLSDQGGCFVVNVDLRNRLNGKFFALSKQKIDDSSIYGTLENFFRNNFNAFFSEKTYVFSGHFQNFLRELINAIGLIHHQGFHHGNVKIGNIFYHKFDDDCVFFLRDYQASKETYLFKRQVADWCDLSSVIVSIQKIYVDVRMKQRTSKNGTRKYRDFIMVGLDDLINILKNAKQETLISIWDMALESIPFQNSYERKKYITVTVPKLIKTEKSYCTNLDKELNKYFVENSWNSVFSLYLKEMENYKNINKLDPYNYKSGSSFIKYVSGVYTHCNELKMSAEYKSLDYVDSYFITNFPTLFTKLKIIEEALLKGHLVKCQKK